MSRPYDRWHVQWTHSRGPLMKTSMALLLMSVVVVGMSAVHDQTLATVVAAPRVQPVQMVSASFVGDIHGARALCRRELRAVVQLCPDGRTDPQRAVFLHLPNGVGRSFGVRRDAEPPRWPALPDQDRPDASGLRLDIKSFRAGHAHNLLFQTPVMYPTSLSPASSRVHAASKSCSYGVAAP